MYPKDLEQLCEAARCQFPELYISKGVPVALQAHRRIFGPPCCHRHFQHSGCRRSWWQATQQISSLVLPQLPTTLNPPAKNAATDSRDHLLIRRESILLYFPQRTERSTELEQPFPDSPQPLEASLSRAVAGVQGEDGLQTILLWRRPGKPVLESTGGSGIHQLCTCDVTGYLYYFNAATDGQL